MTDAQAWRIQQLEQQVKELEQEIKELRSLRDQLLGMSVAAKWGLRLLVPLGGTGAIDLIARLIHWLNTPAPSIR